MQRTKKRQEEEIQNLLSQHSPSQLDQIIQRTCPFYKDDNGEVTSVYNTLHSAAQGRILVQLQIRFENFRVGGENPRDGYSIDGSIEINDGKAEIKAEEGSKGLAVIEVKTGKIKPLQAAAYSFWEDVPVLTAELETGDVHYLDRQVADILLEELLDHHENIEELRERGERIPGEFQCRNCSREECPHYKESNYTPDNILEKKANIFSNIDEVVDKLAEELQSIIEENGYSIRLDGDDSIGQEGKENDS
ncbi:MAG: hypothetical protein SV253_10430 [Halobacteria archaeon]|nr:hypothetical protein [Halobacteria archaeon]